MADRLKDVSGRTARAVGPVRVKLPAKVAYDPQALKESIGDILERLGCPSCFSGASCLFENERTFVLGDGARRVEPDPMPWTPDAVATSKHRAVVAVAPEVKYDIDNVFAAIDRVIDVLGPHPCISGFDVLFRDEIIVVNPELQAQQF